MLSETFCCEVHIKKPVLVFLSNIIVNKGLPRGASLTEYQINHVLLCIVLPLRRSSALRLQKVYVPNTANDRVLEKS